MGITTVIKRLLGVEDVNWDSDGLDSRFPVETSTGDTRSVKRVNSSDIPSTHTLRKRSRIGTGNPITGGKDVDGHLQEVYDDLAKIGEPDGVTTEVSSGQLKVKEVGAAQIATDAVITTKILNANVTTEKIALLAVDTGQLADDAVTSGKIIDDAVTSGKIEDGAVIPAALASNAVVTVKIGDGEVTGAKLNLSTGPIKQPQFFCVAAGFHTWADSASLQETTIAGVLRTDILIGTVPSSQSTDDNYYNYLLRVKTTEDEKIEFKGGLIDSQITASYAIFRAVTT